VRSSSIVMLGPLVQGSPQMLLIKRNVEELSANRSVEALAVGVRQRRSAGGADRLHAHSLDRPVDSRRERARSIVDQPFISVSPGKCLPELLDRPIGCWVSGDVRMQNLATPDLHDDKDVEYLKSKCECGQEVASNDRLSMVAEKRLPALAVEPSSVVRRYAGHVLGDRSRRQSYANLQEKLREHGDSGAVGRATRLGAMFHK